jgi:hypothetical protein
MKNVAKKMCLLCLMVMLFSMSAFALSGCFLDSRGKKIDHEIWDATILGKGNETHVRIWGLNKKGLELSKTQTEAVIPETIGGYPVKILDNYRPKWPPENDSAHAELGGLTKITITTSVTIDHHFFGDSNITVLEFTNEKPSILKEIGHGKHGSFLYIVPEESDDDYLVSAPGFVTGYIGFKPSEIINGYLIKNQVFYGYIGGTESHMEIPEGVTDLAEYSLYMLYPIESVKFPKTLQLIRSQNPFKAFDSLKKALIATGTEIQEGAFNLAVEIEYYTD